MDNEFEAVIEKIENSRSETERLLAELVGIDTAVPPGNNYEKATRLVGDYLEDLGCKVTLFEVPENYLELSGAKRFDPPLEGPRKNVIAEFGPDGHETLLFNGHLDTVPVGPGWSKSPSGEMDHGIFYGRGAADNKGGVVAMIMATKALIQAGYMPHGKIILTATVDEEIGGIAGFGALIEEGVVRADYGVIVDGGQEFIGISNQGRFKGKIITEGVSVHSSRAQDGINAIETMAKIVLVIEEHGRELRERVTKIPAPPSSGKISIYPTATVGTIRGGLKDNIVPDHCVITFSRRVTPEENLERAREEFLRVIEKAVAGDPRAKWRYEEWNTRDSSYTAADHPFVIRFKKVAENVLQREVPIYGGLGGSDACFMRNNLKIPTVEFGAAREGAKPHGTDEHIKIDHILDASKVYAAFIIDLLGVVK